MPASRLPFNANKPDFTEEDFVKLLVSLKRMHMQRVAAGEIPARSRKSKRGRKPALQAQAQPN